MILGSLTERITCTAIKNKIQETKNFPWGNHKGENPATSSEIELAPIAKVKTKDTKMISDNYSLFHLCEILLSHSCDTIE